MADERPQPPWDYLIEKSGGATTNETYKAHEEAIAAGDYEEAQAILDRACRDVS